MEELRAVLQAAESMGQGEAPLGLAPATARAEAALKNKNLTVAETREIMAVVAELWNSSIDMTKQEPAARDIATVRQCASDLVAVVPLANLPPHDRVGAVNVLLQAGRCWAALEEYEAADAVLSKGLESGHWLQDTCLVSRTWASLEQECGAAYFGLLIERMLAGWKLNQHMLSSSMMGQAKDFACDERVPHREGFAYKLELVHQLKSQGSALVKGGQDEQAKTLLTLAYEVLCTVDAVHADSELPALGAELQGLACQVLTLLAWCNSTPGESGSFDQAVSCLQALRATDPEPAASFVLPFLSHHLYLQMGRFDEAQTELLSLVSHEDIAPEVCMAAIVAALAVPAGVQAVQSALPLVLERFTGDTTVLLALVGVLHSQASVSVEVEELVLEVLGDERWLEILQEEPEQRCHLHALLWNHAVRLLGDQHFERALHFFGCSLALAEGPERRAWVLHSQALCCSSMRSFDRALQYLAAAEAEQPRSLRTGFMRLKVSLAAQQEAAAITAISQLVACNGGTPDVLRVACIEALGAGMPAAAKQALLMLLDSFSAEGASSEQYEAGYEATVFQNLIKLVLDTTVPASCQAAPMDVDGAAAASGLDQEAGNSRAAELSKFVDMAVLRMKAVGPSKFFGNEEGRPVPGMDWLALTAWAAACEASATGLMQQAAVLMGASGEFWAAHPQPTAAVLSKQKTAFLFAATAALDVYDEKPEFENALALARQYLLGAKQAAAAMQNGLPLAAAPGDEKADAFLLLMEFGLATRQKDVKAQLGAVERAKAMPSLSADYFAKMAAPCKEGRHKNLDVCKVAEHAALLRLTSEPALNYPVVAATLRSLIELSKTDAEKLQLLSEARSILCNAPKGAYPDREVQWLVTTAWNRGHLHARLHGEEGVRYMRLALDLLRQHCPSLAKHEEKMEASLEAAIADQAGATEGPLQTAAKPGGRAGEGR